MTTHLRNSLKTTCLALLLALTCCSAFAASPAALRKAPYLIFPGDPATMQILWQSNGTVPCTLEWGIDTGYELGKTETREYGTDHQHTFTFEELTPGQKYFYRVMVADTAYTGSFHAAPPTDAPRVQFFAYGDTRTDVDAHDKVAGLILQAIAEDP
jgi:phosphodiesterase/alkaline phosphatase D-like protein